MYFMHSESIAQEKAVIVTANWVFHCVNTIRNPFVNPELINNSLSREMGYSI